MGAKSTIFQTLALRHICLGSQAKTCSPMEWGHPGPIQILLVYPQLALPLERLVPCAAYWRFSASCVRMLFFLHTLPSCMYPHYIWAIATFSPSLPAPLPPPKKKKKIEITIHRRRGTSPGVTRTRSGWPPSQTGASSRRRWWLWVRWRRRVCVCGVLCVVNVLCVHAAYVLCVCVCAVGWDEREGGGGGGLGVGVWVCG